MGADNLLISWIYIFLKIVFIDFYLKTVLI